MPRNTVSAEEVKENVIDDHLGIRGAVHMEHLDVPSKLITFDPDHI